jgi:hypothetical protein
MVHCSNSLLLRAVGRLSICAGFCWAVSAQSALGQDCRIYTVVHDLRTSNAGAPTKNESSEARSIVGRSLSLFHAGTVYDYLDSIGEVTVFDPACGGFWLVSPSRRKVAWASLTELQRLVDEDEERAATHCLKLATLSDHEHPIELNRTRFLLAPDFRETWDAERSQLRLNGSFCEYRVRCTPPQSPTFVEAYFRYADWTAKLNYLLHPRVLWPASRIRLNAVLRERRVLPIEVELAVTPRQEMRLCAKHSLSWTLESKDRAMIRDFEAMLQDKHFERISFRTFRRGTLEPGVVTESTARPATLR